MCLLVPTDQPKFRLLRYLPNSGALDAPEGHAELIFDDVDVPIDNVIGGEGVMQLLLKWTLIINRVKVVVLQSLQVDLGLVVYTTA